MSAATRPVRFASRAGTAAVTRRTSEGRKGGPASLPSRRRCRDVDVQHEFPDLLLELLDLLVLEAFLFARPAAQAVLGAGEEELPPLLHLRHRQAVLPGGL